MASSNWRNWPGNLWYHTTRVPPHQVDQAQIDGEQGDKKEGKKARSNKKYSVILKNSETIELAWLLAKINFFKLYFIILSLGD